MIELQHSHAQTLAPEIDLDSAESLYDIH
jgi:hypothetical protein